MFAKKPPPSAPEDVWYTKAKDGAAHLLSHLAPFLMQSFNYSERWVRQHSNIGLGATLNAFTLKYDLYFRLFPNPETGWPRETLVLARIGFKDPRNGHGRRLLTLIIGLASEIGYQHIAIECANENSSAFGKRFGLQPMDDRGLNWIGSVDDVRRALGQPV
ncbi:hypothetical protein [Pseudomonas rossensis]|uniref:hypothetical protein n=1 Tax=Pseudomonas rossensis TaxID=2305471 RepID=UPI003261B1C8